MTKMTVDRLLGAGFAPRDEEDRHRTERAKDHRMSGRGVGARMGEAVQLDLVLHAGDWRGALAVTVGDYTDPGIDPNLPPDRAGPWLLLRIEGGEYDGLRLWFEVAGEALNHQPGLALQTPETESDVARGRLNIAWPGDEPPFDLNPSTMGLPPDPLAVWPFPAWPRHGEPVGGTPDVPGEYEPDHDPFGNAYPTDGSDADFVPPFGGCTPTDCAPHCGGHPLRDEDPHEKMVHDVAAALTEVVGQVFNETGQEIPEGGYGLDVIERRPGGRIVARFTGTDESGGDSGAAPPRDYAGEIEFDPEACRWSGAWRYNDTVPQ